MSHLERAAKLFGRALQRIRPASTQALTATGNYGTWQEALADSSGYDAQSIVERTRSALIEVRAGRAVFERDGVLFQEPDHRWPLLACLLHVAVQRGGQLRVLDFGGALGSTYFQCRPFLGESSSVTWNVVEQAAHVSCGRKEFESEELRFYGTIEESFRSRGSDVLLLSGVLSYLPDPHAFLREALERGFSHVLVDRTPFMRDDRDRLTVERVPDQIYRAAYPAWFLSETRFLEAFARYELIARFSAIDSLQPEGGAADFKGFFFRHEGG